MASARKEVRSNEAVPTPSVEQRGHAASALSLCIENPEDVAVSISFTNCRRKQNICYDCAIISNSKNVFAVFILASVASAKGRGGDLGAPHSGVQAFERSGIRACGAPGGRFGAALGTGWYAVGG